MHTCKAINERTAHETTVLRRSFAGFCGRLCHIPSDEFDMHIQKMVALNQVMDQMIINGVSRPPSRMGRHRTDAQQLYTMPQQRRLDDHSAFAPPRVRSMTPAPFSVVRQEQEHPRRAAPIFMRRRNVASTCSDDDIDNHHFRLPPPSPSPQFRRPLPPAHSMTSRTVIHAPARCDDLEARRSSISVAPSRVSSTTQHQASQPTRPRACTPRPLPPAPLPPMRLRTLDRQAWYGGSNEDDDDCVVTACSTPKRKKRGSKVTTASRRRPAKRKPAKKSSATTTPGVSASEVENDVIDVNVTSEEEKKGEEEAESKEQGPDPDPALDAES